jgi:hypothetical protein
MYQKAGDLFYWYAYTVYANLFIYPDGRCSYMLLSLFLFAGIMLLSEVKCLNFTNTMIDFLFHIRVLRLREQSRGPICKIYD